MSISKPENAVRTAHERPAGQKLGRILRPLGWLLLILIVVYAWSVYNAPIDRMQGLIQKILYVHPPLAYGAYLGFVITGISGGIYLWRREEAWDRLAIAGAEVGVLFCSLMIITGPIWAKGTWGRFWSWDPRLTVTLLLWFVYLAYILLRSFSAGGERTARFAAVYGIVGIVLIPLNYYIIEIFSGRSMHPENLERGSLGTGMGFPFLMGNLTLFIAFVYLVLLRWQVETLRAEEGRRLRERAGEQVP